MPTDPTPHTPMAHSTAVHIRVFGAALLCIALAVAATGIYGRMHDASALQSAAGRSAITAVEVVTPTLAPSQQVLVLPGNVTPFYEANIYARVNGYLKAWYTDIGTRVKAGQLLGLIETPELDEQIHRAEADLTLAQANLELARITAQRWQTLLETDSVSRQETDEKIGAAKAASATLNAVRANLESLRDQQAFNRVVAPFDGVVTDRKTDIGMLINAGNGNGNGLPLFRVADTSRLRVYVDVPQSFADDIKPGLHAEIRFPERQEQWYAATLVNSAGALHESSRTLTVELLLENHGGALMPGTYVEVRLSFPAHRNIVRVPASTLLFRKNDMEVATVDEGGRVVLHHVTLGRDLGATVEIMSGISRGDRVIDAPPDSLAQGDAVTIVRTTDQPAVAAS